MLQTGTFYSRANNENAVEYNEPITNVYIYFSQNGDRKLTVKTDSKGKFSFDLPVGSYQVAVSAGANSQVRSLAGGSPFELTSTSKQNAFEEWVLAPVYLKPEENPLVVLMRELAQKANDSAVKAKESEEAAEKTAEEFKKDTVGQGKIMREGAFGVGGVNLMTSDRAYDVSFRNMFFGYASSSTSPFGASGNSVKLSNWDHLQSEIFVSNTGEIKMRYVSRDMTWNPVVTIYTDKNTTIDSNGNLKAASPIIKLFDTHIEHNDSFAEEPEFEKLDTGVYKITNTLGLAEEGWTHNIPLNSNGKGYFRVRIEKLEDGCIVRLFKAKNVLDPETFEINEIDGDPVDIAADQRWIDLRFHEEPIEYEEIEEAQSNQDKFLEENNAVLL